MNDAILAALNRRGITRLCHFTPARNLAHIAAGRVGIFSTASLEADERAAYNQTDLKRFDGRKSHICCSIQFPNGWYFDKARKEERLFTDWVVLLISPNYLADDSTLFCPRNAAAEYGRHIVTGVAGFNSLFAQNVQGAQNLTWHRGPQHRLNCPTDEQAEILIYDRILIKDVMGVAVRSVEQAATERARMRANGVDPSQFQFVIAPQMFDKYALSNVIRQGAVADETPYIPPVSI
ncbi:DUF4433 domain-containing protein [Agrobacterium rhizogenes]|uniref:DarT ssDNA thymidine ADP-ribosyltransferase family protein n=1 Tax=Rhizobium rhizogenes TaxID=359 RepID=UPI001572FEE3|nr:DarT ssDNA thymidine ADP-ribosyltransferase family protein [Rhizobium rhizogenes]NTH25642.1 DUF4433 domain-containing protein [Rhizobium rhizogenes]